MTNRFMVLEVTSDHPDRHRRAKRFGYARSRIPSYLLVGRRERTVTLFGEPDGTTDPVDYCQDIGVPFGKPLGLPEPFSFALDTADFDRVVRLGGARGGEFVPDPAVAVGPADEVVTPVERPGVGDRVE